MTSIEPIRDTILQLLFATKNYVVSHTPNTEDKNVYSMASDACRDIINQNSGIHILIDRLTESKLQCKVIKNPWFGQHTPRKQAETAHDHAIEIVRTLTTRFITGVSSESKTVYKEADVYGKPKPY